MLRLRSALLPAAVAAALVLAGCTTGPTEFRSSTPAAAPASGDGAEPGAYPVTLTDAFGSATITKEPKRVVTLGWSDADHVAALGVAPVGAPKVTWGGNANLSTDWFDEQLAAIGGAQPTRFDDADGNPVEEIARLQPDLILATNSGITKDEYDTLSKLAPVVAYPTVAYGTSWRDSLETIGKALGRPKQAAEVEKRTVATLDAARATYPQLAGKTFIYGYIAPTDLSQIGFYTPSDLRPQMLTELGMRNSPFVQDRAKGSTEFYLTVSSEQAASLEADVFLTYVTEDSEVPAMTKDPLVGQVPAIKAGALVATKDQKVGLTMSSPTPLSIPFMTRLFVPLVAAAADKAEKAEKADAS
ncbi:iron-siderophore ABC transporter substrate-binding protein [Intrasporangium sp. YIM S08009]|uniref:iron-siderophore ABC transporter substrate-binding protein n=1 Tax=Intrasporangium zincisolvens TaxID=3080018 RepID=UPI002B058C3A|nr:iron-siderophore ABC transporter substrate-binding protein [Intrasporangium sp. YIM S08009]